MTYTVIHQHTNLCLEIKVKCRAGFGWSCGRRWAQGKTFLRTVSCSSKTDFENISLQTGTDTGGGAGD